MNRFISSIAIATLVLATAQSAQAQSFGTTDDPSHNDAAFVSLALGVTSTGAGAMALRNDSRFLTALGIPLIALGTSDLALALVEFRGNATDEAFDRRLYRARVGLLFSGAGLASFGAYLGSDIAAGSGLAIASHTALRLLLSALMPDRETQRVNVGVSVVPTEGGTLATATVGGTL